MSPLQQICFDIEMLTLILGTGLNCFHPRLCHNYFQTRSKVLLFLAFVNKCFLLKNAMRSPEVIVP